MFLLFALMYSYQMVYMVVALKIKRGKSSGLQNVQSHKYAVIIAARNEELVIGQLIKSIKNQKYPNGLIDIFVIADNCTDNTAQVAREAGAIVQGAFQYVSDWKRICPRLYDKNHRKGIFSQENMKDILCLMQTIFLMRII